MNVLLHAAPVCFCALAVLLWIDADPKRAQFSIWNKLSNRTDMLRFSGWLALLVALSILSAAHGFARALPFLFAELIVTAIMIQVFNAFRPKRHFVMGGAIMAGALMLSAGFAVGAMT